MQVAGCLDAQCVGVVGVDRQGFAGQCDGVLKLPSTQRHRRLSGVHPGDLRVLLRQERILCHGRVGFVFRQQELSGGQVGGPVFFVQFLIRTLQIIVQNVSGLLAGSFFAEGGVAIQNLAGRDECSGGFLMGVLVDDMLYRVIGCLGFGAAVERFEQSALQQNRLRLERRERECLFRVVEGVMILPDLLQRLGHRDVPRPLRRALFLPGPQRLEGLGIVSLEPFGARLGDRGRDGRR